MAEEAKKVRLKRLKVLNRLKSFKCLKEPNNVNFHFPFFQSLLKALARAKLALKNSISYTAKPIVVPNLQGVICEILLEVLCKTMIFFMGN